MDRNLSAHPNGMSYWDDHLTFEDKEKIRLLVNNFSLIGQPFTCNQLTIPNNVNFRDFWGEVLFLISRYDLLRGLNLCEVAVGKRLANETSNINFDESSCLMLKMYNEITPNMELDFHNHFELIRPDFRSELNQWIESRNPHTLTLAEKMQICMIESNDFSKLQRIFSTLGWNKIVESILNVRKPIQNNDIPSYPMDRSPCGKCIIINNNVVKFMNRREGSELDEEAMAKTFENFDFVIERYQNLSAVDLRSVLIAAANEDHSLYCAFVCCIMSHGSEGGFRSSDGQLIPIKEVINMFSGRKCNSLLGKPKLFLIQACQGDGLQLASFNYQLEFDGPTNHSVVLHDNSTDWLLGLAALEGSGAIRIPNRGSWFIQTLAEAFKKYSEMELVRPYVQDKVGNMTVSVNCDQFATQIPKWEDTLSKRLVFRRK